MSARILHRPTGLLAVCDTCGETHETQRADIAHDWIDNRHVCDLGTLRAIRWAKAQRPDGAA